VAVGQAQHFLPIIIIAAGFPPQIGGLDGGHQYLDGARTILFGPHDPLDFLQHAQPERQPAINAGRDLPDHAGAQHQLVGEDLGVARRFLQDGQEIA
jgi:hypothetical protein